MLQSIIANLKSSAVATRLEKDNLHSNHKEVNAKEYSNYRANVLISHTVNYVQKFFKLGFNRTCESLTSKYKEGFRKDRGVRRKIFNIIGESKRIPEKTLVLLH